MPQTASPGRPPSFYSEDTGGAATGSDFVIQLFSSPDDEPEGGDYNTDPVAQDSPASRSSGNGVAEFYSEDSNPNQRVGLARHRSGGHNPPPPVTNAAPRPNPQPFPASHMSEERAGKPGVVRRLQKLMPGYQQKDLIKGVKQLGSDEQREKYRVTIEHKMKRGGTLFDTDWVVSGWKAKSSNNLVGRADNQIPLPEIWKKPCIWVCAPNAQDKPTFYSHICKVDRFHHSTFVGGDSVIGAGEWIVKQGRLVSFSANSGHYRTEMPQFYNAALHLRNAVRPDTTVLLWDGHMNEWALVPYQDFIRSPTRSGRYRTSRLAAS